MPIADRVHYFERKEKKCLRRTSQLAACRRVLGALFMIGYVKASGSLTHKVNWLRICPTCDAAPSHKTGRRCCFKCGQRPLSSKTQRVRDTCCCIRIAVLRSVHKLHQADAEMYHIDEYEAHHKPSSKPSSATAIVTSTTAEDTCVQQGRPNTPNTQHGPLSNISGRLHGTSGSQQT